MTVSVTNIGTNSGKAVASLAIAIPSGGVPQFATIVVGACDSAQKLLSATVSDNVNGSYLSKIAFFINGNPSNGDFCVWAFALSAALTSADSITISGLTSDTVAASAFYVTGVTGVSLTADTDGSSATPSVGPLTPTVPGSAIAGFVFTAGPSGDTFTQDSTDGSYATPPNRVGTTGGTASANRTVAGGTLIQATPAAISYKPTLGTSRAWGAGLLVLSPLVFTPFFRRPRLIENPVFRYRPHNA